MYLLSSILSIFSSVWSVLLAFVVLMVMVTIHEFGHYIAGTVFDFQINEFSVGMGPKIFSKTRKDGQIFSLRLLPLGGYCAFEGEDESNENPRAFNNQKPWKRLIVLFSGAFFNFVSAIIIAIIVFSCYGDTVAKVNYVYDYAPSYNQQLQNGDIIYKVNGKRVYILDGISRYIDGDTMTIDVIRNGSIVTLNGIGTQSYCVPVVTSLQGEYFNGDYKLAVGDTIYKINGNSLSNSGDLDKFVAQSGDVCVVGVVYVDGVVDFSVPKTAFMSHEISCDEMQYSGVGMSMTYQNYKFGFGESLVRTVPYCCETAMLVLRTLGGLFTGAVGIDQVGGPITTISLTSQVVANGFGDTLLLIVLISVNLAVFNLLPVPALDGCRMVFVIIEWIAGKPINRKVEGWINTIGLFVLLGLMILVDLLKL